MAHRRSHRPSPSDTALGLVLIDYDNLYETLADRTTGGEQAHRFVLAMLAELRRYLQDEIGVRAVRAVAYGDFARHETDTGVVLNDLVGAGVEVRHAPASVSPTDSITCLTIHATELLHSRPDLGAFVVLSGSNWYTPLVQHLQRFGKFVLVASLDLPPNLGLLHSGIADAFLNARFLLDARTRDAIKEVAPEQALIGSPVGATAESAQSRAPKEVTEVEDEGARHALEVIEEFFGQYEEVYLTPLLRKLTETLDAEDGEPKDLVSMLQDAGAVWLEKRRGFPYDYTVLLVNAEHPDVKQAREAFAEFSADDGESDFESDDDYDEDEDEDAFEDDYDDDDAVKPA